MRMQRFEIKAKTPSMNEIIGVNRTNRYAGASAKKRYHNMVVWSIKAAKLHRVQVRQWIHYEFHEKTKKRDKDNLLAAIKPVNDALQQAGILPNDNNNWVAGLSMSFVYDKTDRLIVTLADYVEDKDVEQRDP